MMLLRSATAHDLLNVAAWITSQRDCEFWAGHALAYPLRLETLSHDISLSPETSFCFAGSRVLAFGQLIDKGNGRVHLAKIIVYPQMRDGGIGTRFVASLIDKATEQSFALIGLNVHPDNHAAINLYKKLAFQFVERPATVNPAPGSLYMARVLAS